ncbi:MAG: hypothetical protein O2868_13410 [Proteobacteria bacterium]|jgi:hypothetical protein|nr:hypothetical protein [Pseudomonadota bacterium]
MPDTADDSAFDKIYSTDLIYVADCWRLCGDAHCCHFSRYRSASPSDRGLQKIPMLLGEYEYMQSRGYLDQYPSVELETQEIRSTDFEFRFETLSIPTEGCPCEHNIRPTMCRLYPLMPVFTPEQGLVDVDTESTPFEVVETLSNSPRACQVDAIPFAQLSKFLAICAAIQSAPRLVFSIMAYRLAQNTFREKLQSTMRDQNITVFEALARLSMRNELVDQPALATGLQALSGQFESVGLSITTAGSR